MYEYLTGEMIFGDDAYIPEEYMDECWWYIEGFPNYRISNLGRVWSITSGIFLKPKKLDKQGHIGVCLHRDGIPYYRYIHRLVAEAFIPNPHNYPNVLHIYDYKDRNAYHDLKWGTQKDNAQDCIRNGNHHEITPEERDIWLEKVRIPVYAIHISDGYKLRYNSLCDAVKDIGVQQSNAWKVLRGKRPHTCGWKFEEALQE